MSAPSSIYGAPPKGGFFSPNIFCSPPLHTPWCIVCSPVGWEANTVSPFFIRGPPQNGGPYRGHRAKKLGKKRSPAPPQNQKTGGSGNSPPKKGVLKKKRGDLCGKPGKTIVSRAGEILKKPPVFVSTNVDQGNPAFTHRGRCEKRGPP